MEHMYWLNGARTHSPFHSENPLRPPPQPSPASTIHCRFKMAISLPPPLLFSLPQFGGEGRGRPKTAGPVRPIRGSTGCQGAAIGWLGRPSCLSSCLASSSLRPPPIRRGPFTPKVPPKTQPTWHLAPTLTQNAGISSLFLQILRASSKFWIFSIIDNNLHQFLGRRHLEDLSVNIRMQSSKYLPHLHLTSPPSPLGK